MNTQCSIYTTLNYAIEYGTALCRIAHIRETIDGHVINLYKVIRHIQHNGTTWQSITQPSKHSNSIQNQSKAVWPGLSRTAAGRRDRGQDKSDSAQPFGEVKYFSIRCNESQHLLGVVKQRVSRTQSTNRESRQPWIVPPFARSWDINTG